jgi:hypothetical protein
VSPAAPMAALHGPSSAPWPRWASLPHGGVPPSRVAPAPSPRSSRSQLGARRSGGSSGAATIFARSHLALCLCAQPWQRSWKPPTRYAVSRPQSRQVPLYRRLRAASLEPSGSAKRVVRLGARDAHRLRDLDAVQALLVAEPGRLGGLGKPFGERRLRRDLPSLAGQADEGWTSSGEPVKVACGHWPSLTPPRSFGVRLLDAVMVLGRWRQALRAVRKLQAACPHAEVLRHLAEPVRLVGFSNERRGTLPTMPRAANSS